MSSAYSKAAPTTASHYAFMLGIHPFLSRVEVEAVLGEQISEPVVVKQNIAFVTTHKPIDASAVMQRLGGTVKIVEMLGVFDDEAMTEWLFAQIDTATKFHFGFSMYALEPGVSTKNAVRTIHRLGLSLKRALKEAGYSCRFVSSQEPVLSSVIVHKERLLKNGVEVVLLKGAAGMQYGKTLAVQPFQEFSKRDYGRPQRDVKSGMLPPKLARMMVNLSQPVAESVMLDPFCGSGTVLQEALLLGYTHVLGSDVSAKAIDDTRRNLEWLNLPMIPVHVAPAQELITRNIVQPASVDRIVFEGFLGPPTPYEKNLPRVKEELQKLYEEVFPVLRKLLRADGRIVAALPFWFVGGQQHHLNIETIAARAGLKMQREPLYYRRQQSIVGREIITLS